MSMTSAAAPYRRDDRAALRVPVVMPLVEVTVDKTGYLTVVARPRALLRRRRAAARGPPAGARATSPPTWARRFESRCTRQTTRRSPTSSPLTGTPAEPRRLARQAALASPSASLRRGLPADEEVAVAVVVAHQIASTDGHRSTPPATRPARSPPGRCAHRPESGTVMVSGGAA